MWLSFYDGDWEFHLEGCSFGVSSDEGRLHVSFFSGHICEGVCFRW